jgi:hypothetical protein
MWFVLKDWRTDSRKSQKVDKWLRRHFSSLRNACLHLKGISTLRQCKLGYKTHSPPLPTGSLVSGSPYIRQYAVFLFSFLQLNSLQIKSFRPLLLESACAFILRAGSRTLSIWNFCTCHLCIIFGDHEGTSLHLRSV